MGADKVWNVGMPLYPGCTLLDFAGATQIFAFASNFKPFWLAADLAPIATTEGIQVLPNFSFDSHPDIDLMFVPGGGASGVVDAMFDSRLQEFVTRIGAQASWVGSVCTGAFVLAAAGLLDKCRATTYWSQLENLALFPEISVETGTYPRYLIDAGMRRFTGGGISSSMDLALELVKYLAGDQAAQTTQLSNQYAPDPPVHAGDPSQAPADITASVLAAQQQSFILPIRQAVQRILGC
jgi:cyclohexyl-isocyanide hydratase